MGISRCTYYDAPKRAADDTALVEAMHAIKDEFEAYWLAADGGGSQPAGLGGEPQEAQRLMREG